MIQSFDLMSDEEGTLAHQAKGTLHLGIHPQARKFFILAKCPMQAVLQEAKSQGEGTAVFKFHPVLKRPDPNNPDVQEKFHENIPFKTLKEVKQACTMCGSIEPFTLGLLQSVVEDTARPPDDLTGMAKACLSPDDYLLWKIGLIELCQELANHNLAHGLQITADMLMGRGPLKA
jgi:hypothetical protein